MTAAKVLVKKRVANSKNPPYFSQEFFLQNYADLFASLGIILVSGLMFEFSRPFSSKFLTLHHNVTLSSSSGIPIHETNDDGTLNPLFIEEQMKQQGSMMIFKSGITDIFNVMFIAVIFLITRQVLQEYIFDKICRRLHLSKTKIVLFNESAHLAIFFVVYTTLSVYLMFDDSKVKEDPFLNLFRDYPHHYLTFKLKIFYLSQLGYWVQTLLSFYFQRLKRDEMLHQLTYAAPHLLYLTMLYGLHLYRLGLYLIVVSYLTSALFHLGRLSIYYFCIGSGAMRATTSNHKSASEIKHSTFFSFYNFFFPIFCVLSVLLTFGVMWQGMSTLAPPVNEGAQYGQLLDARHFVTRMFVIGSVFLLNIVQLWFYIRYQLKKRRASNSSSCFNKTLKSGRSQQSKAKLRSEEKSKKDE